MNLQKLFNMQKQLDEHIMDEHPELKGQDNLDWKILALQVELGECANEWRGFKKWSNDQRPRTEDWVECEACNGTGDLNYERVQEDAESYNRKHEYMDCHYCDCSGTTGTRNPLLEEYVDCLHFILSIGLEIRFSDYDDIHGCKPAPDALGLFSDIYHAIDGFEQVFAKQKMQLVALKSIDKDKIYSSYKGLFGLFVGLGETLGFAWQQIEQAYLDKNAVNHKRQNTGY